MQAELGDAGLVVIGINTADAPEEAARFLERIPADIEIVYDSDGAIASAHGLEGMPMAYVYDREGILGTSHIGFDERSSRERTEELRELVRR